jgi:hypothetical protein
MVGANSGHSLEEKERQAKTKNVVYNEVLLRHQ